MLGDRLHKLSYEHNGVVLLTGVDKPRIGYNPKNKKFGVWFDDTSGVWGNYDRESYGGFFPRTEHFYYTRDMVDIWIKQCQILKSYCQRLIDNNTIFDHDTDLYYHTPRGNIVFNVHDIYFKLAIYSTWSENIFQAKKQSSFFFPEHNNWFFKSEHVSSRACDYHYGQLIDFIDGIKPEYIRYKNDIPMKFRELSTNILVV
jgi:hypothetical protein